MLHIDQDGTALSLSRGSCLRVSESDFARAGLYLFLVLSVGAGLPLPPVSAPRQSGPGDSSGLHACAALGHEAAQFRGVDARGAGRVSSSFLD